MAGTSGSGKSTLARLVGQRTGAVVIDYDVVKTAALDAGVSWDMAGLIGYGGSRAVADSLLKQGLSVILDSPCRFEQIVIEGTAIAAKHKATYAFVECILHDQAELCRRMAARSRLRSQRIAFNEPPPDAPGDVMADASGKIKIPQTKYPTTPYLRVDTRQLLENCLDTVLIYLQTINEES